MIRTVTHKILKISVAVSLIAQTVLSPVSLCASKPISGITSEHIFEIADETTNFARDDLFETGKEKAAGSEFSDSQRTENDQQEWNWGWENDAVVDESDLDTFFSESIWHEERALTATKNKTIHPKKQISEPGQIISVEEDNSTSPSNPVVDKVLQLSKKKHVPNSPSSSGGLNWDFQKAKKSADADISSAQSRTSSLVQKKPEFSNRIVNEEPSVQKATEQARTSLGKKIVTVDPYLTLKEENQKRKPQKQTLSSAKKAEPAASFPITASLSGPNQPKVEIAEVKTAPTVPDDNQIIAQALPDRSLSSSQGKTPPKTILINFNNVSIIEYIRFISRITNRNFIFDENDLQFNVTIISEDPTSIENVMTALIQELRIHGLYLIEQENNLIIHRNKEERSISRVNTNGAPETSPRDSELVTQVFRLNTLDPGRAQRIINPLLSNNAIIETSDDTRHIIVTDLVTNIKEIEILFKDIDSPNSGLVIGQYVVRNAFIDNLIELANKIMEPIAQDQSLTFVPHPAAKSIFIVASPFLVERSISVLQHLDQFQGSTRIYDLDELKFQQIAPKEAAPALAPDKGLPSVPQEGVITPGLPTLPTLPQDIDLPEPVTPTVPAAPKKPAEDGKWELGPSGNWIFRPGFPSEAADPSQLPQGQWLLDPQSNWYFEPVGSDSPFRRSGADPGTRGSGIRESLLPGEAPKGRWLLDPQGSWVFQLAPGEELKPERLSRPSFIEEELPIGRIERTQFFIHKLQYRRGEDIRVALESISGSLSSCGNVNEDLICAIQSVQWLEASNSMIFAGTSTAIEKVRELINEIDQPLRQVFIEMLILETTLDDSLNYGVSWATRSGGGSTATAQAYIGGASPLVAALSGNPLENNPDSGNLATGLGYTLGVIGQRLTHNGTQFASLGALVSAQHQRSDSNVVLNPKIITEDNKTAELFVGINTRFQTNSISNDEGSVITTNFEYRDVGTTIRVTPLIGHGDIVTLEIEEEVSRVSPQSSEGEGTNTSDASNAPTTSISRTSTTVHVPDKHFVIISGLVQDEKIHSRNQFPCLGGIPIIGAAFSAKVNSDAKRTQMLFIRPCIIDTDEEMRQLTCDQQEIYKQKNRTRKMWKYEVDEGMDYLNIKPPCCDECD